MESLEHPLSASGPVLRTGRGRLVRCGQCGGMYLEFGNLSTRLDAESFLRLSGVVHRAAAALARDRVPGAKVAIPMAQGAVSLVLDRSELEELYRLVNAGRHWIFDDVDKGEVLH
jgi:hypothetical protein